MAFARFLSLGPVLAAAACAATPPAAGAGGGTYGSGSWIPYSCADGSVLDARYPNTNTAEVRRAGQTIPLTIALSASGARYTGDGWEWWTKGPEGTLSRLRPGETIASDPGLTCRSSP